MTKFSYFQTLGEALTTLFRNYQIFSPIIIMFFVSLAFIPLYNRAGWGTAEGFLSFSAGKMLLFVLIYVLLSVLSLIVYGWVFVLVKQVIKTRKTDLKEAFKKSFGAAWKLFKVGLLIVLITAGLYLLVIVLMGIGALFNVLVPGLGLILMLVFGLLALSAFLLFSFFIFNLVPVLVLEEGGAWKSLCLGWKYSLKNKKQTVLMGLITMALIILGYIPVLVFMFSVGGIASGKYLTDIPVSFHLYSALLSLPLIIIVLWMIIFYTLAYTKTKGDKEPAAKETRETF